MNDFNYYIWFIYNEYDGNGRKTPKYIQKQKTKEKSPVWLPSHPPSIKLEADCFPGRMNRKQAGPTLGGMGILIYRGKEKIKGRARYGSIQTGNMIFIDMNVQDLQ